MLFRSEILEKLDYGKDNPLHTTPIFLFANILQIAVCLEELLDIKSQMLNPRYILLRSLLEVVCKLEYLALDSENYKRFLEFSYRSVNEEEKLLNKIKKSKIEKINYENLDLEFLDLKSRFS